MVRKIAVLAFTLILALPASSRTPQGSEGASHTALHLMNNGEFRLFLGRLDANLAAAKAQLKTLHVASLRVQKREGKEIRRSYELCLEALKNTREEIQELSQRQTLKLDFLLLVDLNELTRNLDRLGSDLANPITVQGAAAGEKSLGYARKVLGIDSALAPHVAEFQQHVLAFAGVVDAALDQAEQRADLVPDPNPK